MIRVPKGVKALYYEKSRVGKHFKRSKKKHTWKFALDDAEHTVELYVSKLSSKRKILVDGDIRTSTKSTSGVLFSYPFKLGRHMLMVVQQETMWDLRIDSVSFQQLYALQKPSSSYESDDWVAPPASDFKTASSGWSQRPQEFEAMEGARQKPWGERDDFESFPSGNQAQQGLSEWEVFARPDPKNKPHAWETNEDDQRFSQHSPKQASFPHHDPFRSSPRGYRESPDFDSDYRSSPKQESRGYESLRPEVKQRSSTIQAPRQEPRPEQKPKPEQRPKPEQKPVDLFDTEAPGSHIPADLFAAPTKEPAPQLSFPSAPQNTMPDLFASSSPTGAQGQQGQFQPWQTAQPAPQQWPAGMQPNPMMMNPMTAMMMNQYYTAMMTGAMMKPGMNPNQRPF